MRLLLTIIGTLALVLGVIADGWLIVMMFTQLSR